MKKGFTSTLSKRFIKTDTQKGYSIVVQLVEGDKLVFPEIKLKRFNPTAFAIDFYHICIALLPAVYIINVPGLNISLGTVILIGFVPHSLIYVIKGINRKNRISAFAFFAFYLYLVFRSDGNPTRIILCCATFLLLYGQMKGAIINEKIRSIIELYAIINVALLILQVVSYYVFHTQIQYIPQKLIYEEYQNSYVFREFTGLYRPSALFLEPSHFSQYCIFALISTLFPAQSSRPNMKKAILIGLGCVLTTSGMGIGLTAGVFAWYLFFNRQHFDKKVRLIIRLLPILVIGFIILSRTAFFQTALQRVFSTVDGYNAISGRTHNWDDAVGTMHGSLLWFGYGDSHNYKLYLTGLADTIYKYGVLCVILEGICFLYLMIRKKDNFVWCCCIVFAVLFYVAHITNFVSQVFYFGILIADASIQKHNKSEFFQEKLISKLEEASG